MCWFSSKCTDIKIANEDVEVFKIVKIVDDEIKPYFFYNNGAYGKINDDKTFEVLKRGFFSSDIGLSLDFDYYYGRLSCEIAIHSYLPEMTKIITRSYNSIGTIYIENKKGETIQDYHESRYENNKLLIMDCIIPKGTKYALNEHGEVVSEQIQVKRFREINNII